jgi:hypothetical protein
LRSGVVAACQKLGMVIAIKLMISYGNGNNKKCVFSKGKKPRKILMILDIEN